MPVTSRSAPVAGTTLALKEWGAVAHGLLDGRQTVLLRKGGIHEKRFQVGRDTFVLFPTVAHSHRERVRDEHADLIGLGEADVAGGRLTVRCGITLAGVVPVERAEGLVDIRDLHIWTAESVRRDRLEFRPKHRLQVLVVAAVSLPDPVTVPRLDEYGGCKSWLDLPLSWDGRQGRRVHSDERLAADVERVRAAVG
ncbi:MAG: DUF1802 family protein [Actinobacteria bacterium]|nr:DUF1802 family protein [Actinomycetota bacterium]